MKPVRELIQALDSAEAFGDLNVPVAAVCYDSRQVTPASLFVAIAGLGADRHRFLEDALAAGACAFVVQADRRPLWEQYLGRLPLVSVPDTQAALAPIAAAFYDYPARKLRTVGITGTDGKSTTTEFCAQLLAAAGYRVGMLSTVAFRVGEQRWLNTFHTTTLEATEVQFYLAQMCDAGCAYAVIEASSHGLALHRVDRCEFDVAVFTTLTPDHLDFHGTFEAYRAAKGRLFQLLDNAVDKGVAKAAILNADDPASDYFRTLTRARVWTYGLSAPAQVRAEDLRCEGLQTSFRLVTPTGTCAAHLNLPGRFNVANALAATACALSQGVDLGLIATALPELRAPEGRMEVIGGPQPFTVIVDFAATPDGLRKALTAARPLTRHNTGAGRLIVLFGCAGERDPGRRTGMGQVAGELADFAVLTNEDPRSEDPEQILRQIAAAYEAAGRSRADYVLIPDRRAAMQCAFAFARPGDVVLLCGKATEPYIEMAGYRIPWDERRTARELLQELYG